MAVAYSGDTLTGIRTPLCWTPLNPAACTKSRHFGLERLARQGTKQVGLEGGVLADAKRHHFGRNSSRVLTALIEKWHLLIYGWPCRMTGVPSE